MSALQSVIDPSNLNWIWLTHPDFDHIGCLHRLLAENPKIRVVTMFLGVGILSLSAPLPMDRVHLLNPGGKLTAEARATSRHRPAPHSARGAKSKCPTDTLSTAAWKKGRSPRLLCGEMPRHAMPQFRTGRPSRIRARRG